MEDRDILDELNKKFGSGTAMMLGDPNVPSSVSYRISTGSTLFDIDLGGGIPGGRIIEVHGPEAGGKSTLCGSIIANHQRAGGVAMLMDTERVFEASRAAQIGIDVAKLGYLQPETVEDALIMIETILERVKANKESKPYLIVWDSLAATPSKAEVDAEIGDKHMATTARAMSDGLKKIVALVSDSKATLIITNQIRDNIGVTYGPQYTVSGGRALPFYASVRIHVRKSGDDRDAAGNLRGVYITTKTIKNKTAIPLKETQLYLNFSGGFEDALPFWNRLTERKLLTQAGAWYTINNEDGTPYKKFQGVNAYLENYASDPVFKALVMSKLGVVSNG